MLPVSFWLEIDIFCCCGFFFIFFVLPVDMVCTVTLSLFDFQVFYQSNCLQSRKLVQMILFEKENIIN